MHHDHGTHDDEDALAELLDLEADLLRDYWADALAWVRHAVGGSPRRHILDLGAGTGAGTVQLAQRFDGAKVTAVDSSAAMLDRIRDKALDLGLADRIRTVQADLDMDWPVLGPLDVTWASMSLHHMAEPDQVLARVRAQTRPGGLIAVAELTERLRLLPDELGFGRTGLEVRLLDALGAEAARTMPALGSDWSAWLTSAGLTVIDERSYAVDVAPPRLPQARRFAQLWFGRLSAGFADRLDPDDQAALARLLDGDGPGCISQRGDLRLQGVRTVTLARRD